MEIVFLTIITGRKWKDEILKELVGCRAQLIDTIYSRDYIDAGNFEYAFGLIPDDNEVVLTCIMDKNSADRVLEILYETYNFKNHRTGIAFTTPVEKLSF